MSLDPEFEAELFGRHRGAIEPGLEKIEALLKALGNPELRFPSVHIAGTNGKGTVAHTVAGILCAHGLRVGLFTSPHLQRLNERFVVNGVEVPDHILKGLFEEVVGVADDLEAEGGMTITFFEISTAVAFLYFSRSQVDLAVVETGLGGRLDSTNVLSPLVSVITSVAMDHETYLGTTISAIATEKAGIIKPDTPVVIGELLEEARSVCLDIAASRGAPFIDIRDTTQVTQPRSRGSLSVETGQTSYRGIQIEKFGSPQQSNLAVSLISSELVLERLGVAVDPARSVAAVSALQIPGRFERISENPEMRCDVAHNPAAFVALRDAVLEVYGDRSVHVVIGMCVDKGLAACMATVEEFAESVEVVPIQDKRSANPELLAEHISGEVRINSTLRAALESARIRADKDNGLVLVCGSVFLVGELRELQEMS